MNRKRRSGYDRYTAACDAITDVLNLGGQFNGMADLYAPNAVRMPDGSGAVEGAILRIEGRLYRVTDATTGAVAGDVVKCLRQFAADLSAAADEIESRVNPKASFWSEEHPVNVIVGSPLDLASRGSKGGAN